MQIDTTHYTKALQIEKTAIEVFAEHTEVLNTGWTRLLLLQFEFGWVRAVHQLPFPKMVKE